MMLGLQAEELVDCHKLTQMHTFWICIFPLMYGLKNLKYALYRSKRIWKLGSDQSENYKQNTLGCQCLRYL